MKVLFVIWNYWPGVEGGSERQARQVASELEKRGHHCTIWTAWQDTHVPKIEVKDQTDIVRLGRWVPWQEKTRRVLARLHKFFHGNIVKWSPESGRSYDRFKKHFDFWALLPIVYITRYSFMREVRKEFENSLISPDIIHLHEPSWLGGFVAQLAKPRNIPVLCQEATNPPLPKLGYDVPHRKGNERYRRCAHFIAMAVTTMSPMQMIPDAPSDYEREPECAKFLLSIPTVWDETRVFDAKMGDYLVVARRNNKDWYLAATTDWSARDLTFDFSFLPAGTFTLDLVRDGINADIRAIDYKMETIKVTKETKLKVHLAPGGGWVGRIR